MDDLIQKENKRLVRIAAAGVILVVCFAVVIFLYQTEQAVRVATLVRDIKQARSIGEMVVAVRPEIASSEEMRNRLDMHFITKNTADSFKQELEVMGKGAGITEGDIKVEIDGSVGRVSAKGNYADLYYFFKLVENIPYKMRLNSVDMVAGARTSKMSAKQQTEWTLLVSFDLLGYLDDELNGVRPFGEEGQTPFNSPVELAKEAISAKVLAPDRIAKSLSGVIAKQNAQNDLLRNRPIFIDPSR